jgi:hypothetical protein
MREVHQYYEDQQRSPPIVLTFADDTNGLLSAADSATLKADADEWMTVLQAAFNKIGVELNPSSSMYSRQHLDFDALDCGIGVDRKGVKVLGVPVGDREFTQAKARRRLKSSYATLERIPELDPFTAVKLLRLCVNQRPNFLARTMPSADFSDLAAEWDEAVAACLRRILRAPSDTPLNPRWYIHGDGGLDITRLETERFAIHYQAWVQSRLTCDEMALELRSLTGCSRDSEHPVIAEIFSCYDKLPAETRAIAIPPEDHPSHLQPLDNDPDTPCAAPPLLSQHKVVQAHF